MATRWVVGIDGSENALSALRWAAHNAQDRDVQIVALHAWHVPLTLAALFVKRGIDVDRLGLAAIAGHEVDAALGVIGNDAIEIESLVVEGHPAAKLLEQSGPSSVLVLGRRGAGELRQVVLGSVTRHCATHAHGPVVVVPPTWEPSPSKEIVVGFDGSVGSREALRWALDFAEERATVRALAAIDVAPGLDEVTTEQRYPKAVAAEKARIQTLLDEADPDGRAERSIVLHSPHQALAHVEASSALLVVGARGDRRRTARLLGSVSTWILTSARCPVAVVPLPEGLSDQ